jgi:serine/threonine protein phosphatase PrpC
VPQVLHWASGMVALEFGAATDVGGRLNNEDRLLADGSLGLFLVADGMGGYEGGEIASQQAVDSVRDFVARNQRDPGGTWPCREDRRRSFEENLLAAAISRAHEDVAARRVGPLAEMGSTLVALLAAPHRTVLAHVGDSRAYLLRKGELKRLTVDHSLQVEMQAQGVSFPYRNVITRALGVANHRPDLLLLELSPGDALLLCTDGLHEVVPEGEMADLLNAATAHRAARALVDRALSLGARDNVTVVVVRAG